MVDRPQDFPFLFSIHDQSRGADLAILKIRDREGKYDKEHAASKKFTIRPLTILSGSQYVTVVSASQKQITSFAGAFPVGAAVFHCDFSCSRPTPQGR